METLTTPGRVLRLIGNNVALQPMRRFRSETGILYDMSRMDDKTQFRVVNMSERAWRGLRGDVQNGDHVVIKPGSEHAFEWPDGIILTDARNIIAKV